MLRLLSAMIHLLKNKIPFSNKREFSSDFTNSWSKLENRIKLIVKILSIKLSQMTVLVFATQVVQQVHQKGQCFLTKTIAHFWVHVNTIKMLSLIKMMLFCLICHFHTFSRDNCFMWFFMLVDQLYITQEMCKR